MHSSKSKVLHPKMTVKKLPEDPEAADPAATEEETTDKKDEVKEPKYYR